MVNDFRLYLTSRVPGDGNQPGEFRTHFNSPLELEGADWEVGIESLHYLHSWFDIYKDMNVAMLIRDPGERYPEELDALRVTTMENLPLEYAELTEGERHCLDNKFIEWNNENKPNEIPNLEYSWFYEHHREKIVKWLTEYTELELLVLVAHPYDTPGATPFARALMEYRKKNMLWGYVLKYGKLTKGNILSPQQLCERVNIAITQAAGNLASPIQRTGLTAAAAEDIPRIKVEYDELRKKVIISTRNLGLFLICDWGFSILHTLGFTNPAQRPIGEYGMTLDVLELSGHSQRVKCRSRNITKHVLWDVHLLRHYRSC